MFFILSKILAFLIHPLSWVFILLIFTFRTKNPRKKKKRFIYTLLVLYFFSNRFILAEANRLWEIPTQNVNTLQHKSIAVILGGFTEYDPEYERVEFYESSDRLLIGYQLYQKHIVDKLVMTGGSSKITGPKYREGDMVQHYLSSIGMPQEDLWIERESRNTYENALYTRKLLDKKGTSSESFYLITSSGHMRRSLACFEKQGLQPIPLSVDRRAGPRKFQLDHLLIPDEQAMIGWYKLFHEWTGYFSYWLAGYV
ncbi:MAG: hypothetical protein CL843_08835 [Crocinitomicaceae bacterium]|nr:hypothetical protein [Crocinitomicaceae bacterium]|tara:strand:+ start:9744 stop:10508 length:765 start_codon:yes stop_codon:yes gene_type:complete